MNAARHSKPAEKTTSHHTAPAITAAPHSPHSTVYLRAELQSAFQLLLACYNYAHDAKRDAWQLAVEIDELRQRGLALSDLRWLVAKEFAEHRRELTVPGDPDRSFRPLLPTEFPGTTAVALTQSGATALSMLLSEEKRAVQKPSEPLLPENPQEPMVAAACKPVWDGSRRELRFEDQVVKRFRVPALNQETILQAFQEDGWPHCVDDPLPPNKDSDAKGRLLATIKSLNRNQLSPLILFHGNGNGFQIYWEPSNEHKTL